MQHQEHYGDAAWRSLMTLSPQKKGQKRKGIKDGFVEIWEFHFRKMASYEVLLEDL